MIKLRTAVDLPEFKKKMGYHHPSMMIGSCFTENIGIYLQERCFPVMINPFGILYNPVSIANSLKMLINGKEFTEQDLFFSNGLYHSFAHHSRFSGSDQAETLARINRQSAEASEILKNCHHLFITFGTSWVFEHKISGSVVSNCHKLPASIFERYRLSVAQITEIWIPLIGAMQKLNPNLHLVFTVSPIRHLKDGAHENQLSKSTLLLAIDDLIAHFKNASITYFPSYEFVLDELRDYRFYGADMTHLSDIAIDLVREKFAAAMLDQEAKTISEELEKILLALKHRPINIHSTDYTSFIEKQLERTHQFQKKYPFVDVQMVIIRLCEKRID